jgi:protein-tyrosine-phosphatase
VHTIGGFLNLAESLPPHGESLEEWLIRVGGSRPVASLLAENTHEEISDPHGQSRRAHRKTFDRLESTSRDVADVLSAMSAVHRP